MEQHDESEETPTRVTDKRGQKKGNHGLDYVPTAEELLQQGDAAPSTTFEQQSAEEAARQAAWDAMTSEEKEAELARQAAEVEGVPFQGGGMQAPPDEHAGKKLVLSMFTIVVHRDGTAVASDDLDLSKFEAEFPVDANVIYRSVCEIKKDIESTAAATATLQMMNTHAAMMAQQQQAAAIAQSLEKRGVHPPRPPRR